MMQKIFGNKIIRLKEVSNKIDLIHEALGRIETRGNLNIDSNNINDYEFKVFSQNGEDGIIQYILSKIKGTEKTFIEFGVQNYLESNTRFLLQSYGWCGLVIDANEKNIRYIKNRFEKKYRLTATCAFITKDNINNLITNHGFKGEVGILSIDIDGNDFSIWEAINCFNPKIVICEYNSLFGPTAEVSIPYNEKFIREQAHHSYLYYGASISALAKLGEQKGFSLVGSNLAGNNLFFVQNEFASNFEVLSPIEAYKKQMFCEARNQKGEMIFLNYSERIKQIQDLPIYDFKSDSIKTIKESL